MLIDLVEYRKPAKEACGDATPEALMILIDRLADIVSASPAWAIAGKDVREATEVQDSEILDSVPSNGESKNSLLAGGAA